MGLCWGTPYACVLFFPRPWVFLKWSHSGLNPNQHSLQSKPHWTSFCKILEPYTHHTQCYAPAFGRPSHSFFLMHKVEIPNFQPNMCHFWQSSVVAILNQKQQDPSQGPCHICDMGRSRKIVQLVHHDFRNKWKKERKNGFPHVTPGQQP